MEQLTMYDDTMSFSLLGTEAFYYGLFIALACIAGLIVLAMISRQKRFPAGTVALFGALALPLGLLCSRGLFCALDFNFHGVFSLRALLSFWGGGLSMTGALLGAVLAARLTARIQKIPPLVLLDALVPALLLFMAVARLGEPYTNDLLGRSRSLTVEPLQGTFLSIGDEYGLYRLRTYLIEAVSCAVLAVILWRYLRKSPRPGNVLLTGMLLLGCAEVYWHSMRTDAHMFFTFINLQQILYACMFAAPLLIFALRCHSRACLWMAIGICALVVGGAVWLEFLIDRSSIPHLALYVPYLLLVILPAAAGLNFRKRSERP